MTPPRIHVDVSAGRRAEPCVAIEGVPHRLTAAQARALAADLHHAAGVAADLEPPTYVSDPTQEPF